MYHNEEERLYRESVCYGKIGEYAGMMHGVELHVGDIVQYTGPHGNIKKNVVVKYNKDKFISFDDYGLMGWCGNTFEDLVLNGDVGSDITVDTSYKDVTEEIIAKDTCVSFKIEQHIDGVVRLIDF